MADRYTRGNSFSFFYVYKYVLIFHTLIHQSMFASENIRIACVTKASQTQEAPANYHVE